MSVAWNLVLLRAVRGAPRHLTVHSLHIMCQRTEQTQSYSHTHTFHTILYTGFQPTHGIYTLALLVGAVQDERSS